METENKEIEQMNLFEDDVEQTEESKIDPEAKDELKDAIEETLSKLRMQSMLLGAQAICQTILDKIIAFDKKPGSKSNNDHKRLIKDIKQFCEVGLSRKVNTDGTTEAVQN